MIYEIQNHTINLKLYLEFLADDTQWRKIAVSHHFDKYFSKLKSFIIRNYICISEPWPPKIEFPLK